MLICIEQDWGSVYPKPRRARQAAAADHKPRAGATAGRQLDRQDADLQKAGLPGPRTGPSALQRMLASARSAARQVPAEIKCVQPE